MAKQKLKPRPRRNGTPEPEAPETTEAADGSEATEPEATKPKASPAELKSLFTEYREAEETLAAAQSKVDEAKLARSLVVKQILEAGGSGPYRFEGKNLRVMTHSGTYFFRTESAEVTEIL